MTALLWLRRDLRLHDNPALCEALRHGATKAVYISTPKQWLSHNLSPIQADLTRRQLALIHKQLRGVGIKLYHLKASDFQEQTQVLRDFCSQNGIQSVFANREPEMNECNRDNALKRSGINLTLYNCDTILPVGTVLNKQGQMFKVFTPFKNAWLKRLRLTGVECLPTPAMTNRTLDSSELSFEAKFDYPVADSSCWPLSDVVMQSVVPDFLERKLASYQQHRDFPSIKGTSGLSPYLAIGAISPRWLVTQLLQYQPELIDDSSIAGFSWLNELIWRDFYRHLLFHYPDLVKGNSFQKKYQSLIWPGNPDHFTAWCEGRTGYPIVDAAMTQLTQTGWMHNRLRMIVASFLAKHLLIDWRLGERFFMSKLIDGDFSSNNGGWQWSASTGCDAQPYFRIFNPITQSKKFDPNGDFIRKYLPVLRDIPDKEIHFPHSYLESCGQPERYSSPIVDHNEARQSALEFFKQYQ